MSVPSLLAEMNVKAVLSVHLIQLSVTNPLLVRNLLQLVLLHTLSFSGGAYLSAEKVGKGKKIAYSQRSQRMPSALHLSHGFHPIHFFWNSLCTPESDIDFMQPRLFLILVQFGFDFEIKQHIYTSMYYCMSVLIRNVFNFTFGF